MTGVLSKSKTNFGNNNFLNFAVACNKNISNNSLLKQKVSCFKPFTASSQSKLFSNTHVSSPKQSANKSYYNSNGSLQNEMSRLQSTISIVKRHIASDSDKSSSIPGLGMKKQTPHESAEQAKNVQATSTTESGSNEGGEKEENKDTWYSGKNAWKIGLACLSITGISTLAGFIIKFGDLMIIVMMMK